MLFRFKQYQFLCNKYNNLYSSLIEHILIHVTNKEEIKHKIYAYKIKVNRQLFYFKTNSSKLRKRRSFPSIDILFYILKKFSPL